MHDTSRTTSLILLLLFVVYNTGYCDTKFRYGISSQYGISSSMAMGPDSKSGTMLGFDARIMFPGNRFAILLCYFSTNFLRDEADTRVEIKHAGLGFRTYLNKNDDRFFAGLYIGPYFLGKYRYYEVFEIDDHTTVAFSPSAGVEIFAYDPFTFVIEPLRLHFIGNNLNFFTCSIGVNILFY